MPRISVIIPAYNEEATIRKVLEGFYRALPKAYFYVIDNNSTDFTRKAAEAAIKKLGLKGDVIFEPRRGKASAVRRAFTEIDSDIFVLVDADCTYSPHDAAGLLFPVSNDSADMVVGDRISGGYYSRENKRPFHNFGNHLVKLIINFIFKSSLKDIMSGYRVFNRKFVKNFPILSEGFEIETEMTLHALDKRFRIVEIPVDYRDRPQGSKSKLNTIKDGFKVIMTIFRILRDYKPLQFFGSTAIFCFLAGIIIGLPVIAEYIKYRYIFKVPSAILAMGFIIISFLLMSIGLILDTISRQYRFNYEYSLLSYSSSKRTGLNNSTISGNGSSFRAR